MNSNSISSSTTHTLFKSPNKPSIPQFYFKSPKFSIRNPNLSTKAVSAAVTPPPETLYDLLGISNNVTPSEIKRAYKRMALKYHPDVSPPDRAEEHTVRFIRVQEAYQTLSDPEARFTYDSGMAQGLQLVFSGKNRTRFDPRSEEKTRWKEAWKGQMSELDRRSRVNPNRVDPNGGMSWGARIRMQRSGSCGDGSGRDQ